MSGGISVTRMPTSITKCRKHLASATMCCKQHYECSRRSRRKKKKKKAIVVVLLLCVLLFLLRVWNEEKIL